MHLTLQKVKKSKTSKVKKNNIKKTKLYRQGKIKSKKPKTSVSLASSAQKLKNETDKEEENSHDTLDAKNLLQMIDVKDLEFLKKAVSDPSYSFYNNFR